MSVRTANKRNWESTFQFWSEPPSQTERDKCANAESVIRRAISGNQPLQNRKIRVFAQGSYRNRTNVRLDSDVDICVLCTDVGYSDFNFAQGLTDADVNRIPATYTYSQFKNEVEQALRSLGTDAITRSNKAFDVHANSYRVDADVVPCFEHLRYQRLSDGSIDCIRGTELHPDNGGSIVNWPDQHYENGVAKNNETGKAFKGVVRILKRLKNQMKDEGVTDAQEVPSFLIECLVWNVPSILIDVGTTWTEKVQSVMRFIHDQIQKSQHTEWGEVSDLKYLFRAGQPWTPEIANRFIVAAWNYLEF